jgi:hypothetical protein
MNQSEFQSLKAAYEAQDLSARKFCETRGLAYGTWTYWSRKSRVLENPVERTSSFLQVLPETSDSCTATVESPSGWRVHVSASLAEILAVLPA